MSKVPAAIPGPIEVRRGKGAAQALRPARGRLAEGRAAQARKAYDPRSRIRPNAAGAGLVVLVHVLAIYALSHQPLMQRAVEHVLQVRMVASPPPRPTAPAAPVQVKLTLQQPELHLPRMEPPKLVIAAEPVPEVVSPVPAAIQAVTWAPAIPAVLASAPVVSPAPPAPPEVAPVASGPVALSGELALACPERTPPIYPASSRRRGETGQVMLRVELDERGDVSAAKLERSSGSTDLDQAALAAVRSWHCQPPRRDGLAVRAVAMQPFNFTLRGH